MCDRSRWVYDEAHGTCNQCLPGRWGHYCNRTCAPGCHGSEGTCRGGVHGDGLCVCSPGLRAAGNGTRHYTCAAGHFTVTAYAISLSALGVVAIAVICVVCCAPAWASRLRLRTRQCALACLRWRSCPGSWFFMTVAVDIYGAPLLLAMYGILAGFILIPGAAVLVVPLAVFPVGKQPLINLLFCTLPGLFILPIGLIARAIYASFQETAKAKELYDARLDVERLQAGHLIQGDAVELFEHVASGGFGAVFKARWKVLPGAVVAVKKFFATPANIGEDGTDMVSILDEAEVRVMARLRHRRLVVFLGAGTLPDGTKFLMSEWCPGGDLSTRLQRARGGGSRGGDELPWSRRVEYARDVAQGMLYLHTCNVLHLDLKSGNVLLDGDDRCKIADFGLSRMGLGQREGAWQAGGGGAAAEAPVGSLPWMAPELLACLGGGGGRGGEKATADHTREVDVYAFGVLLWEILTCSEPYHALTSSEIVARVSRDGLRPLVPERGQEEAPEGWVGLMERCWSHSPHERPNFRNVHTALRATTVSRTSVESTDADGQGKDLAAGSSGGGARTAGETKYDHDASHRANFSTLPTNERQSCGSGAASVAGSTSVDLTRPGTGLAERRRSSLSSEVLMSRLRKKITPYGVEIKMARGLGYYLKVKA